MRVVFGVSTGTDEDLDATLAFFERVQDSADGTSRPPRGRLEIDRWMKRKAWSGEQTPLSLMWAERFLVYSSMQEESPCGSAHAFGRT